MLNNCGQLENLKKRISRLNLAILVVCETTLPNNRDFVSDKHLIINTSMHRQHKYRNVYFLFYDSQRQGSV